ncbi:hypothetical protein [Pseudoxanthomonas sp. PXM01]|uniref:DUF6988 family protein n=1 Tax=Pseudoxanthomonas sp. PXM01 TaxID=2769295 RepID=UPI00177CCD2E|nr:hypothetical protein [Pseudoxanthomonas sp. PXM01]MBD9470213.1 hypothetical protein [Pseudoxanthomonas sp. PXM01]
MGHGWDKPKPAAIERLERISHGTRLLRQSLDDLWDELPDPSSRRLVAVRGFANIVWQHAAAQWVLIQSELDVSATALVRPTYEALLRTMWTFRGADDSWIDGFLSPNSEALNSDAETRKGPDVTAMLHTLAKHHPADICEPLVALRDATWRAMHSYVHGGIRAVAQSSMPFPHHEAGSVLINANGMLILTTNVVRMAHGLSSPTLPLLQQQYADCLPNAPAGGIQDRR